MRLYHGSKSGISGNIRPVSRGTCDFGSGFYMGDMENQPKGLIINYENSEFYEIDYNLEGLAIKEFGDTYEQQIDWSLYIAYNRGFIDTKYGLLCSRYEIYNNTYDLIIGDIADDRMSQALSRFFNGLMCDKALIDALTLIKLDKQYVAKTSTACDGKHLNIVNKYTLSEKDRQIVNSMNKERMTHTERMFDKLEIKYRRNLEVRYFDEIIKEWDKT